VHLIALVQIPSTSAALSLDGFPFSSASVRPCDYLTYHPSPPLARLRLFHELGGQTVILQRKLLSFWERAVLRRWVKRLIFDFDDAVFMRDSFSAKGMQDPSRLRRFTALMRDCDAVVAGNAYLADRQHAGPFPVACISFQPAWIVLYLKRRTWWSPTAAFSWCDWLIEHAPGLRAACRCWKR